MLNFLTTGSTGLDHKIKLKKGFTVMLLATLDTQKTRYVIENMTDFLLPRVTNSSHQGNRVRL